MIRNGFARDGRVMGACSTRGRRGTDSAQAATAVPTKPREPTFEFGCPAVPPFHSAIAFASIFVLRNRSSVLGEGGAEG